MKINPITSISELAKYVPELVRIHENLDGRWEPELGTDEFLAKLVQLFNPGKNYYWGLLNEKGELLYFVTLLPNDKPSAVFWLFYMNKDYRDETHQLLKDLSKWSIEEGYTTIYTQSTRTEKSYERWLSKFGATKVATLYKFNLQ